jgi:dephospho-CoA kinase
MADQKLIIGVAGMPGSGKSLIVKVAKENGYDTVMMGDVVREEVGRRSLEPNPENIGKIMLELRYKEGKAVIAKRCVHRIEETKKRKVIVDGIRSLDEVEEFRSHFSKFSLIAICSSPEARFQRLFRRRRSDDVKGWDAFHERDMRELSVGIGNAIAMAEYTVVNEEGLGIVKNRIRYLLKKVEGKWKK